MIVLNDQEHPPVICLEGNGSRPSHLGGGYSTNGAMFTLNAAEHHAVCFRKSTKPGKDKGEARQEDTITNTLNGFEFHSQVRTPEVVIYKKEETHDPEPVGSAIQTCSHS